MDETVSAYPSRIYVRLYYPTQTRFVVEEFETSCKIIRLILIKCNSTFEEVISPNSLIRIACLWSLIRGW